MSMLGGFYKLIFVCPIGKIINNIVMQKFKFQIENIMNEENSDLFQLREKIFFQSVNQ